MKETRIAKSYKNKYGSQFTIIEYNGARDITIEFKNGYIKYGVEYGNIKKGKVISPYDKTVCDIAYIGEGSAPITIDNKLSLQYSCWSAMIKRCYDSKTQEKHSSYKGCIVCDEWLNYNAFYIWYENNYYQIDDNIMYLDKDIIQKGNKIYSPDNCCFVNNRINCLFTKSDKARGKYPIGVFLHRKIFEARLSKIKDGNKVKIYLGSSNIPEKAFYMYKDGKELYIKEVANEYKDKIPDKLFKAMINYKVEITD